MGSIFQKRTLLVLPAVLLLVTLLQDIVTFVARKHVHDVHTRVGITLLLNGAAFAIAAEWISPWLKTVLLTTRRGSERHAGTVGLLLFYAVAYGALFYAFYVEETRGVAALVPWLR